MLKKVAVVLCLCLVSLFVFSGFVLAFSDIQGDPAEKEILALKEAGIVSGIDDRTFAPRAKLSYAAAVHLVVKGLGININAMLTSKVPKASGFYTKVPDDAWYAQDFVIAHLNGLPIDKDADPNRNLTREEFAHLLIRGMMTQGDFAFVQMFAVLEDEKDINPDYMESIQKLVVSKMAGLENGKFYPKREITRSETAKMLYNVWQFVLGHAKPVPQEPPQAPAANDVTLTIEKVNDQVNKAIVSWGEKPNPGYAISISKIEFDDKIGEASVYYKLQYPRRGVLYIQLITYPKAEAYVASSYKVKAALDTEAAAVRPAPGG